MSCDLVVIRDNAAPEPCDVAGCHRTQARAFALYRTARGWVNAGRYRCEAHREER